MDSRDKNRSEYEDRLANDIHKIKEASSKELEEIRINSRDVYERENRGLREAREEALQVSCKSKTYTLSSSHP